VFALTAADAETVMTVATAFDGADDAFARRVEGHGFDFGAASTFKVGVRESQLQFFGNADAQRACSVRRWIACRKPSAANASRSTCSLFLDTASLLYDGPWVAERYAAIRDFIDKPSPRRRCRDPQIIGGAKRWSAGRCLRLRLPAQGRQAPVRCRVGGGGLHRHAHRRHDLHHRRVGGRPVALNSNLGYYTNFMNLLDYAATAVPAGFQKNGLPFGVTLFAPAHQDGPCCGWPRACSAANAPLGATGLRRKQRRARQRPARAGRCGWPCAAPTCRACRSTGSSPRAAGACCGAVKSSAEYRFYALPGGPPHRPGMVRVAEGGAAIEMEIWELPPGIRQLRRRHPGAPGHRYREARRRRQRTGFRLRSRGRAGRRRHHRAGQLATLPDTLTRCKSASLGRFRLCRV
jgi:allophanate hydrolase